MVDHRSDCAMHNGPHRPPGPCNCGADPGATVPFVATPCDHSDDWYVRQGDYLYAYILNECDPKGRATYIADALNAFARQLASQTIFRAARLDAEREIKLRKAKALARARLVPGDLVTVGLCGGRRTTFRFSTWSDRGYLLRPRDGEVFHPISITRINGKPVDYENVEVTPEELAEICPAVSQRYGRANPPIRGGANGRPKRVKGRADDLPF